MLSCKDVLIAQGRHMKGLSFAGLCTNNHIGTTLVSTGRRDRKLSTPLAPPPPKYQEQISLCFAALSSHTSSQLFIETREKFTFRYLWTQTYMRYLHQGI